MPTANDDARWLAAAAQLSARARPLSRPNPGVACILVKHGQVIARGWTQPGGRPHAEAVALEQAGEAARGATAYVTLEPCAHVSRRGPCCTDALIAASVAEVVVGVEDPDERTKGDGIARLRAAGIAVRLADDNACRASLSGHFCNKIDHRPHVTLKLAITADGFIARPDGTSKWITGAEARAHAHMERARHDAILVGGGTLRADDPGLDVRLPGLDDRSPDRWLLTRGAAPAGWSRLQTPEAIASMEGVQYLMVEGGAQVAASFLDAGLVDHLLLYRSATEFGEGIPAFLDPGPAGGPAGWQLSDSRQLGSDNLSIYERG